ncbi:hypothetical protein pEaSNUABM34_00279 [Erwinia phage pEa_SNUABM_34]|nr:hypothetical protein pEaSNUABM34_00279 [Erwinia phage pEa_SNUABM_34]QYW03922.1 hypothetical protein pEaSNUABM45_00279 [Erwinia phage pEa_SNUABM_45]QYW04263.1 hypothetical protein pEaSNUABM46_00279 [Erwinia phage pEa_SNUABM_46]
MSDPKPKPEVTKADLQHLLHVAGAYEGNDRHRWYAMFIVLKLKRQMDGQNLPRSCANITHESQDYEIEEACYKLGYLS